MEEKYNHAVIRELADAALGDEDLKKICFDHFSDVFDKFTAGQTRGERILFLVEYAKRQGLEPRLINAIKTKNPTQHGRFASRLRCVSDYDGNERAETENPPPTDRDRLPPVCHRLPKRHRIPYRSLGNGFINKVRDMWDIHDILTENKKAVVSGVVVLKGMGGIGKTQLAIEYAHRFGMCYPGGIFWVDTERGKSSVVVQILEGAPDIGIDETLEEEHRLQTLWRILGSFPPTLLILDNFLEDLPLRDWLPPQGSVHTLVTTRRRDLLYSGVSLKTMTETEGLALLNSGEREIGEEGKRLVELLGGLPLAIELAKAYLNNRTRLSVGQVIGAIRETGEIMALKKFADTYSDELPSKHEKHVAATIEISWQAASPTEKSVLQAMSLLAPEPVPARLIRKILDLPSGNVLDDPLHEALCGIDRKLSLADVDRDNDPVMHRLISGFVRTTLSEDDPIFEIVVSAVKTEMARTSDDKDIHAYHELEKIIPHADRLVFSEFIKPEDAIDIANYLSWHYRKWGKYRLAERYGRESVHRSEKHCESELGACQNYLALVLKDLGELEAARDLLRRALASAEKSYDPGHPTIATSQSNLALVLRDLGELEEARDLLKEALASAEKRFDPGHPEIATSQSNLALVLRDLGELEEARDLLRRALASDEKSFDPGHPTIAIRQSNLASVLKNLGELEAARGLLRRALSSDEKSYEPGHPTIARSQSNLATVLQNLGELEAARDLLRRALSSDEKSFDPGHPTIAIRQSNLAMVLKDLGELEDSRDLLRRALSSDEKSYEPGHPAIAIRQSNLAMVLKDLGELEAARDLLKESYRTLFEKFGPDHPHTKIVKGHLDSVV